MCMNNYGRMELCWRERGSFTQGGYAVVYSGSNVKNFDVRSDITYISEQTISSYVTRILIL